MTHVAPQHAAKTRLDPMPSVERSALVQRGKLLTYLTLGYNLAEGVAAIATGAIAGSIALVGFGIDSLVELASSGAALWRLRRDVDPSRRDRAERMSLRIISLCFIALAIYIAADAVRALSARELPQKSIPGIVVAALSVVIMPLLARGKRRVAAKLASRALEADATQSDLCMYLSAIVLGGLVLNAVFGWWWADPVAALALVPIIAKEGIAGLRGDKSCDDCRATV